MAKWKIGNLASLALSLSYQPQVLSWSLESQGYNHIIGHHFFTNLTGVNTPTFSLDALQKPSPLAIVPRINQTDAPPSACPSENGLPAIQWFYLHDAAGLSHGGINTVYRIETAGGNRPATCQGMPPSWEVKYAAECKSIPKTLSRTSLTRRTDWMYGPKSQ